MKFAAVIEYAQDKARIAEVRPIHRQYLAGLKERGQLAASGPFTDDSGALIIYEAASREDAEKLLQADPFQLLPFQAEPAPVTNSDTVLPTGVAVVGATCLSVALINEAL